MGLLPLAVIGGGIYFACKHAKNKRRCRAQQQQQQYAQMNSQAQPGMAGNREVLPGYSEKHQTWCNGNCQGQCNAAIQYTPDEDYERNPGRQDYFQAVEDVSLPRRGSRNEKHSMMKA